nr:MAG TPA: hypothetical protein [Caudoviricetes sp.]
MANARAGADIMREICAGARISTRARVERQNRAKETGKQRFIHRKKRKKQYAQGAVRQSFDLCGE